MKQSYFEAVKTGVLEEILEFVDLVKGIGESDERYTYFESIKNAVNRADIHLKKTAADSGATYVFNVAYDFFIESEIGITCVLASGDAYKPKNNRAKAYEGHIKV